MNERDELEALKREQARLEKELGFVSLRLTRLERQARQAEHAKEIQPQDEPLVAAQPTPPVLVETSVVESPPVLAQAVAEPGPEPVISQTAAPPPLPSYIRTQPAEQARPEPERSLELRLGTYWAPRIGIVVLLTGLVFLGNLAYQKVGAIGRVLLLYAASGTLLSAGAWWQRNGKEALRNYAQVLFAGGLAALYFTTYAAHHLESLRVIQSTFLDGVLLLGCAGFMVWTADRWRSEILAIFGIGLAYYTCVMTHVGYFTLYSNLVLTLAAVFFLVRNRWLGLSFGSLVATYAAYGFWRFFNGQQWHWASPEEGLWSGVYFLASYWIVFTTGVFLSRDEKFAGPNRAAFLTLNNGAFFTMFVLTMLQVNTGGFWKFCLIYGAVLLALAQAANELLPKEDASRNFYLTQGLLLGTIGFISKFAGLQLALILAAESVLLLMFAYQRRNAILFLASYIVAGLSIIWGMDGMRQTDAAGVYLAIGLGGLMLANTLLAHHFINHAIAKASENAGAPVEKRPVWETLSGVDPQHAPGILRPQVAFFVVLALAIWLVATWNNVPHEVFPVVLAGEGLALTVSIYLLRVRELTFFSQGYVLLALFGWLVRWSQAAAPPPWWNPLLLLLIVLALSHWWQTQKAMPASTELSLTTQLLYGLGMVGLLYFWLIKTVGAPEWLALSSALALGLTAYGVLTRAWMLAACGQIFALVSAVQFAWQLTTAHPSGWLALAPIAALGLLSWSTFEWFRLHAASSDRVRVPLLHTATVYRWVALPMCLGWIFTYVPEQERMLVLVLVGLAIFLFAGWKRGQEALLFGGVFTATALIYFWATTTDNSLETIHWLNLLAILIVPAQQQIAKRLPQNYTLDLRVHGAAIFAAGLTLWWFCTRWVMEQSSGFFLTASWSLLALIFFTCGIVLRERVYRWLGLGLLALSLGRIVVVDVWRLEMLYRILSFMALGVVLLVLGFVYSKYQEKIREWL